jgi:tRNA-specific 2-thiouridylase
MKVAVLLSGGVDSSVALSLLREEGHDLTAFYLKVWLEDELAYLGNCPWEEDLRFARAVCSRLDVPLEIHSLQRPYWEKVVSYTLDELRAGRTPSPDVFCNQRIKFGAFFDEVDPSFERVATGHYARIDRADSHSFVTMRRGVDSVKDQTYFLSHLSQRQLHRALFPIGGLTKSEVRSEAARMELPNQARKDSQGICFLGKIRYSDFVRHHLGERRGDIVEAQTGKVLGSHRGYWFHTIGQRQGLGLSHGPWFVSGKDVERNIVFVTHAEELASASRNELRVGALHWIHRAPESSKLLVRLRHGRKLFRASVSWESGAEGGRHLRVELDERDPGVSPGQIAVFYDGDLCLGGGTILG